MSNRESARERRREERRRKQMQRRMILVVVGVVIIGGIAAAILLGGGGDSSGGAYANQWQEIPQMDDISHVSEETPLQYSTNPPTSGQHYDNAAPAGFYDEIVPDGNLVHSLEHGYVIIWFNCDDLDEGECDTLRDDIQRVINNLGGFKLIGVERPGMDTTIALTSWMMLDEFNEFDADRIRAFYRANQSHPRSPEPTAR